SALLNHDLAPRARSSGPRSDRDSLPLENLVRLTPVEEAAELVGADDEDRIVEGLGTEQHDGTRVRVEADVVVRKRRQGEREPILSGGVGGSIAGPLAHEHDETVGIEALPCGVGDGHMTEMWWVEGAAVEDYSHSSVSSPSSTSSPARAPAARRIASRSSSAGGMPVTRKPRSVR